MHRKRMRRIKNVAYQTASKISACGCFFFLINVLQGMYYFLDEILFYKLKKSNNNIKYKAISNTIFKIICCQHRRFGVMMATYLITNLIFILIQKSRY